MLLARYGVLFRDLLARESNAPKWRELLGILRRLEARGEVRGGRFVTGFGGEQFALPEAVDSLREARKHESTTRSPSPPPTRCNLAGIVVPGERVPAVPGTRSPLPQRLTRCSKPCQILRLDAVAQRPPHACREAPVPAVPATTLPAEAVPPAPTLF